MLVVDGKVQNDLQLPLAMAESLFNLADKLEMMRELSGTAHLSFIDNFIGLRRMRKKADRRGGPPKGHCKLFSQA
ncbi:MAG: hypothetical protein WA634_07175 [Silvibacterium sp.]